MNEYSECTSYEILRREAQETMDRTDPSYALYDKQKPVKREKVEKPKERLRKKERLIINPEFVESLDTGDGSVQYDEDYKNEV